MTAWSASVEWIFNSNNLTVAGKYRTTHISGYFDMAPIRGENLIIPGATGRTYVIKFFDQKTIVCGISIQGTTPTDLESNIATLLGYFSDLTQHTLTRNLPNSTQVSCTTVEAMNFTSVQSGLNGKATVDFVCSTPTFS